MSEESKTAQNRREFVKVAAKVAVTAPAVATLLTASVKQAAAAYGALDAPSDHGTFLDPIDNNSIGQDG